MAQIKTPLDGKARLTEVSRHVSAATSLAGALIGLMSMIAGFGWFFAGNEIEAMYREFSGLNEISEVQHLQGQQLNHIEQSVFNNTSAIEALTPTPRVAIYDKLRSKVFTPCNRGAECSYQMRVRRTSFGEVCSRPTVLSRIVIDSSGLINPVLQAGNESVDRFGSDWGIVRSNFLIPATITDGVAEFMMTLQYNCGGELIEEDTIALPFVIISEEG